MQSLFKLSIVGMPEPPATKFEPIKLMCAFSCPFYTPQLCRVSAKTEMSAGHYRIVYNIHKMNGVKEGAVDVLEVV